ncbi:MAG TPA: hypothetical protein VMS65_00045 [Polyangiaceae bacterium]|nr:hypothetical protein [Polyangiaceae bacterium]
MKTLRHRSTQRLALLWLCGSCGVAHATSAYAEPPRAQATESGVRSPAEQAFADGVSLMKRGECPKAIEKFRESQKLEPASGNLLDIAYCEATLDRALPAWLTYQEALALARATHKPEHEKLALEQAAELERKFPQLVIAASAARPGLELELELDGSVIPREFWGGVPVNPGKHAAVALEQGRPVWQSEIDVPAGKQFVLALPVTETPVATEPAHGAPRAPVTSPPRASDAGSSSASAATTAGWIIGGTGVVALLAGSTMVVVARVRYDAVSDSCPDNHCDEPAYDQRTSARTTAHVGMWLAAGGAVLLGTGVVLLLTSNEREERAAPKTAIVFRGNGNGAWLGLDGRF